ncbi:MAG: LacI family transcriptional regulator [Treponema sp.]|jgi:LacI family transcriptional regulator|nr:LacI family transcriptional regulator [Treponema sp.]
MHTVVQKQKITQKDIARYAGVTRSLVSYVINGSDRTVAPETRKKILRAIEDLDYRPNKFAQALMRGDAGTLAYKQIGIVLCRDDVFLRPYYAEILAGIHSAAHAFSHHIRFIRFFNELKDPVLFNQLIHTEEICGLLLVATDQCLETAEDWQIIERIRERIGQIVCVEWRAEGLSSVYFDRQAAACKAVNYLFDKGYTDIVYIGESDERVSGFKQAFLEHGVNDLSKLFIDSARDMPSGYEAIRRLHEGQSPGKLPGQLFRLPQAICAGSDEVAIGILLYLNEHTVKIPGDVAIISIDNIEMAEYTYPPLTTMNVQKRAMGYQAVEMIVNNTAVQGEKALNLSFQTTIVIRKSS